MKSSKTSIAISAVIAFVVGVFLSPQISNTFLNTNSNEPNNNQGSQENSFDIFSYIQSSEADMDLFWDVWDRVEKSYVHEEDIKEDQLVYGATRGMVEALGDPYTVFMDPEETKEFKTSLDGQLNGIGAELEVKDQNLVVVSPIKGSPAEKAGLLPNDIIYKINGELAADLTIFEAVSKIRGERGTAVNLTIIRDLNREPIEMEIIRDTITIESVSYEMKDSNIAYVAISQFNDHTKPEFNEAVNDILLNNPKGIVLDLRFNGGGYLDISVDILSNFISGKKEAVKIKSRYEKDNGSIYVSGNARIADIPLVVLVNGGSASASEIVAGAIQDHQRGLVIGEKTFGKGSVQEVMDDFKDGSSLRVTTAKWLTPNGRSIDEHGIDPDRIVEMTSEDLENNRDPQLDAAVDYLKGL